MSDEKDNLKVAKGYVITKSDGTVLVFTNGPAAMEWVRTYLSSSPQQTLPVPDHVIAAPGAEVPIPEYGYLLGKKE